MGIDPRPQSPTASWAERKSLRFLGAPFFRMGQVEMRFSYMS